MGADVMSCGRRKRRMKEGEMQDTRGREFVFVSVGPPGDCGIVEVNESDWLVGVFSAGSAVCTLTQLHFFISPSLASTHRSMKDRMADEKCVKF